MYTVQVLFPSPWGTSKGLILERIAQSKPAEHEYLFQSCLILIIQSSQKLVYLKKL